MANLLYNKKNIIGRLFQYFQVYFLEFSTPTMESLFLIVLSMLAVESADSICMLYKHFLSKVTEKSLNAFYYACSYAKIDYSKFMNVTARLALEIIPKPLHNEPVFLCVDDTMIAKFGKKFENVSKLFDHATHNGSNYLNGHCFVSLMLCVPVRNKNRIVYQSIPLLYRMWTKEVSKLELAADMVRSVMPELEQKHQVLLLFDSWYAKKPLVCLADEYKNLDIICNARCDSAIYDLPQPPSGKRGRPAKRGKRLSIIEDFSLSTEKIGDYYVGVRKVLTNIFGDRCVRAYVTASNETTNTRRLFFSTIAPEFIRMSSAWQEKAPLSQTGSDWFQYVPLFMYSFRWKIEISYYEQKSFWSLRNYMVRSKKGIETLVNLINISYCAMKILPYKDETFSQYKGISVQEFRLELSQQINHQIIFATFMKNVETTIKSNALIKALKSALLVFNYHG